MDDAEIAIAASDPQDRSTLLELSFRAWRPVFGIVRSVGYRIQAGGSDRAAKKAGPMRNMPGSRRSGRERAGTTRVPGLGRGQGTMAAEEVPP